MATPSTAGSPDHGTLLAGERKVLELIATGAPQETTLDTLCRVIDAQSGLRSSIFLLDPVNDQLGLVAAPNLPAPWRQIVSSFATTKTSCGAAVTGRRQVVSADLSKDPLFDGYHDAARAARIESAWSTPFFSTHNRPLGTFAVYDEVPGEPSPSNLALVARATHLASIAVERHLSEQALRESEIRFSKAFYANPAAMAISSFPDGRITYVNDAFVRILGYSRTETIGQSFQSLGVYIDPEQRPRLLKQLHEGGRIHEAEVRIRAKSGDIREVIVSHERIDVLGAQSVLGIATDITDRKRTEEAVRASERRWRSVFDNSAIGIVCGDSLLRITAANRALQALWGYNEQELTTLTFFDLTYPDDRHFVEEAVADLLSNRALERQFEKRCVRKNGDVIWVRATASLVQEPDEPPTILLLLEDISARKAAEEQLARSLDHARSLAAKLMRAQDEERRRIAGSLHETTAQDLAALKMLLSRLGRTSDGLSEPNRGVLNESVELADRVMTDIRTLSYLLHPPFLDEAGLVSAIRWYVEGFTQRSGIRVELDLPSTLTRLPQDLETTLFRVVQEALINVHRHAESPSAALRLTTANDALALEIEDHGHGMSPDLVAGLNNGVGPIGVGLAGMRERLQQLSGRLQIESSGRGTTVRAIVPLSLTSS